MNFNFGAATTTAAASTFGTPAATTGFAFGSGDQSKNLFGGANTAAAPAAEVKPYSFTSPTPNPPTMGTMGSGAFSFGAKTTPTATGLFGSPTAQPTATAAVSPFGASKPLSFGGFTSPPNQTVGSPGFGQPAAQNNSQNMLFGSATRPDNPPAFGTPASQPSTGIAFGAATAAMSPPPAFGATSTPSTGFSAFGSPSSGFAAPQATTMGAPQSQAPLTLSSGPSVFSTPTPAGFGQMAQPANPQATSAASNFSFGPPSSATGMSFGTSQPQPAQPAAQPTLSFGTSQAQPTGLSLGQQQQKPATAQPTLSFGQPSQPLGFGQTSVSQPSGISQPTGISPLTGLGQPSGMSQSFGTAPVSQSFGLASTAAPVSQTFGLASTAAPVSQSFGLASAAPVSQTSGLPCFSQPSGQTGVPASGGISFASSLPSTGGISLGTMSSAPTPTSVPLSMAPTQPASTGFSLPQSTASTAAPISTSAAPAVSSGLSFGTTGIPLGGSLATTTSAAGFGTLGQKPATSLGFGLSASTQPSLAATTSSAVTSLPSLAKTTAAPTTLPTLTTATSTAPPAIPQAISTINFAELEENINKWTLELETQERTFIGQATQINAWGTLLVSNGEKIVELNDAIQTVKNEQQSLEHELDFVLCQQRELEDLLTPLEKQLCDDGDTVRDPQREQMYSLAENLDSQLRQMSEDLREVIEHLNETNRSQDSSDPIVQIGRILNVHMSSMQWIDNSIAQISTKLDQLRATHDTLRRDNEKSFHLTYN